MASAREWRRPTDARSSRDAVRRAERVLPTEKSEGAVERKKLYPLKQNHLFAKAYRKGKGFSSPSLSLYVLSGRDKSRTYLGITVSKKRGNAVTRNRVKRRIREAYRFYLPDLPGGKLLVLVARENAVRASYWDLREELGVLLARACLLGAGT